MPRQIDFVDRVNKNRNSEILLASTERKRAVHHYYFVTD